MARDVVIATASPRFLAANDAWERSWNAMVGLKQRHKPNLPPIDEWQALCRVHEVVLAEFRAAYTAEARDTPDGPWVARCR